MNPPILKRLRCLRALYGVNCSTKAGAAATGTARAAVVDADPAAPTTEIHKRNTAVRSFRLGAHSYNIHVELFLGIVFQVDIGSERQSHGESGCTNSKLSKLAYGVCVEVDSSKVPKGSFLGVFHPTAEGSREVVGGDLFVQTFTAILPVLAGARHEFLVATVKKLGRV